MPRVWLKLFVLIVFLAPGCSKKHHGGGGTPLPAGDTTPPGAVLSLAFVSAAADSITISWTAPAEDVASGGAATTYDVRFTTGTITDDTSFAAATAATGAPPPATPGTLELMTITGLAAGTTYNIALKSSDEVPNVSALSNVLVAATTAPDVTAPAQITDLAISGATPPTSTTVTLTWTAVGDDGLVGTATSYDIRFTTVGAIIDDATFNAAFAVTTPPTPAASGTPESYTVTGLSPSTTYFFAIKAVDEALNAGAVSNVPGTPNPTASTTASPDTDAPAVVTPFVSTGTTATTASFSWTAPDEDGTTPSGGTCASYDLRFSIGGSITYATATPVSGEPVPAAPGTGQGITVPGLSPGVTYTFAITAIDAAGNVGSVSAPVTVTTVLTFPVVPTLTETEPNDTTATPLPIGTAGVGTLDTSTDVDLWSFSATAGDLVSVELSGTRMSQATWNSSLAVPHLRILDPSSTELVRHDRTPWALGDHDLDIPIFRCPSTGTYTLRLQASNGAASPRQYAVLVRSLTGSLTIETEAVGATGGNDTEATAEPITVPTTVFGWHVDGERDHYSFAVTAGSIINVAIKGYRNGIFMNDAYYNPRLRLFRPSGQQVKNVANTIFRDVEFTYRASETGTYVLRAQDDGSSTGDGPYFLSIDVTASGTATEVDNTLNNAAGTTTDTLAYGGYVNGTVTAGDFDYYAFTGTAGDMVWVKVYDSVINQGASGTVAVTVRDSGDVALASSGPTGTLNIVRTILQTSGTHYVRVAGSSTTAYAVELILFKSAGFESESNDTLATSDSVDVNRRAAGVISSAGDVDCFAISAEAGELVTVDIYAGNAPVPPGSNGDSGRSGWGSTLLPVLDIFDSPVAVTPIATSTAGAANVSAEAVTNGTPTLAVTFVAPSTGTYFVRVGSSAGTGGATQYYAIERH